MASRLLRWMRAEAKAVLDAETRAIAGAANIEVAEVSVGDPRARWGSCSSNGNIRYSWRLILMPDHVRRSIVAHEVAHRVHMDHSRAFHRLEAELFGADPRTARAWLRAHGARLHWFGRD
jgi:predicted metal-dependent hydrolase